MRKVAALGLIRSRCFGALPTSIAVVVVGGGGGAAAAARTDSLAVCIDEVPAAAAGRRARRRRPPPLPSPSTSIVSRARHRRWSAAVGGVAIRPHGARRVAGRTLRTAAMADTTSGYTDTHVR